MFYNYCTSNIRLHELECFAKCIAGNTLRDPLARTQAHIYNLNVQHSKIRKDCRKKLIED